MKKLINYIIAIGVLTCPLWIEYVLPEVRQDTRATYPTEQEINELNK